MTTDRKIKFNDGDKMAICKFCEREMSVTDSCLEWSERFIGGLVLYGIPFYSKDKSETCPDCHVRVGGYHHQWCDQEICPRCGGQRISCDCQETSDSDQLNIPEPNLKGDIMTNRTTKPLYVQQLETAIFCLKQIEYRLSNPKSWNQATGKQVTALRPFIPYCILSAGAGNEITPSILINRDYKPLGCTESPKAVYKTWVDYTNYPWAHFEPPAGMTGEDGRHYFFDDGSAPWNSRCGLDRLIVELEQFLERCTEEVEEGF